MTRRAMLLGTTGTIAMFSLFKWGSSGEAAPAEPFEVEPRMALQELDEMLAHHAGGAEDAYFDSRLHKSFTIC